jgi:hypothetical protein
MTHQEKRNLNLIISLVVLSVITLLYYGFARQEKAIVDSSLFQVEDLMAIDRILLERAGQRADLKYDGARWTITDEAADRDLIDVLFATLQQAKPMRPVAKNLQDSVARALQSTGVKVTLFSGERNELTFFAGGNARKSQAYFQKDGDDYAYIMAIPGYRVYVSGIFELDNLGWKDKFVFQFNWRNFQSLQARFPKASQNNFDVVLAGNFFTVEGMTAVDTTRLNDFLDAVSLLTVDGYLEDTLLLNSLTPANADMFFEVSDVAGRKLSLALYPVAGESGRVTGIINGSQLAVFDRKKLEPIQYGRNYFRLQP